jgi:WD40 repeat protein
MKAAQVFEPHAGPVHAVAFSPDDAILVSGHQDGTIILWDSKTSKELRRWQAHASQVHSLSFAPDGKIIASAATWDSGPRLWDTATGSEKLPLPGHRGVVDWLEFAPDATKLFSIGRERTLLEWDLPSSRAHPPVQWKFPGFAAFTLSRDRQTLASLSYADGALQIWDARGKSAERTLAKYPGSHRQTGAEVRFSPDDKLLACACKESVEIWDRAAGKMLRRLPGYPHGNHIAFSPDGKVLACTEQAARLVDDSLVHLWDVETGRELRRLDTMHALGPIAFSPDGRWLAAGGGWPFGVHGPVQVWNLGDGKTLSLLDPPDGAYGLAFSADGRFLAVAGIERDGVRVLDLQTRKQACHFDGQEYSTVAFAPDGRSLATGCNDGSILVWDLEAKHLGPTPPPPVVSTRSLLAAWQPRPPFRYPEARHGKGELKYINGIPVLTLAGTPEEIGTQMGVLALKPALVDFDLDQFMRESLQSLGPDKSGPWVKLMAQLLVQRYPREYRVELEAMARAAGMDFDFLVLANVLPDLGLFGCSTLLVDPDRSATGKVLFGRNMDFPPRAGLDRMSLLLIYRPDGKPPFASVGFPGVLVGTSTMNAAGLAWTVNSIYSAVDGSGRFNPLGTPLMVWLRQMAEQCADSAAAEKLIRPLTRTGMLSLSVCDKTGGGVFEITPRSLAVRRGDKGLCLCTNHFLTKGLATDTGCWRYPRLAANQKLDKLSCDDIARSLHAVNQGRWTIQTMIFEPADLKLHLAVGRGPVSALPLQQLDLAPLLGR